MFQTVCAARGCVAKGCVSAYGGSGPQSTRRRQRLLALALPAPLLFDRDDHLRIMQQIDQHLSTSDRQDADAAHFLCEGAGGDLFFEMRLYKPLLLSFPRYPRRVCWQA